jgi:hypothetical protein
MFTFFKDVAGYFDEAEINRFIKDAKKDETPKP